ncbi:MAG: glycosyltransferase [Paludibacteraceae bacterium]|nr:glycosyltransferase [Paludibacteraceae bacterium]
MKLCAVIPTYNNEATIASVIKGVSKYVADIIVVIDGATDDTLAEVRSVENEIFGLTTIAYNKNKGKGYALKQGFIEAKKLGFTHALTIDADGQHLPETIPQLLKASKAHPTALLTASRTIGQKNMPAGSSFANRFSNFWFCVQTGLHLKDTQCGLRIYPLDSLPPLWLMTNRYEAELLLLVLMTWANTTIISVPVNVFYPEPENRVSHFRPLYDFTRISVLNTCLCVLALVYGLPRRWWRSALYGSWFLLVFFGFTLYTFLFRIARKLSGIVTDLDYHIAFKRLAYLLVHTLPTQYPLSITNLQTNGTAVYIANHTSVFDVLAVASLTPKLTILTQDWVQHNFFFSQAVHTLGFMSVSESLEKILPELEQRVKDGYSILVFPESTRSQTGVIQRFHRGAFLLAYKLNIPIQPIKLTGLYEVMNKNEIRIGKSKQISIEFLPQIEPQENFKEQTMQVRHYYETLFE